MYFKLYKRFRARYFLFLSFIDYTIHRNHNCGGKRVLKWSNGSNAKYGQMRGLLNCSDVCMNQSDCDGFSHRNSDDVCGLWRKSPLKLHYDKNFDCYLKHRSKFWHHFLYKMLSFCNYLFIYLRNDLLSFIQMKLM